MANYGVGASLASMGQQQQSQAMQALGEAADLESQRNAANKRAEAQNKAGMQQLGGTLGALGGAALGAQYGTALGPWGALIGGAVGAIAGGLFS